MTNEVFAEFEQLKFELADEKRSHAVTARALVEVGEEVERACNAIDSALTITSHLKDALRLGLRY